MDSSHSSSVRFSDTPPGSPKSCMKGSRRINFAPDPGDVGPAGGGESKTTTATATTASKSSSSSTSSGTTSSPKRSTKSVMIKSPEGSANNNMGSDSSQTESHGKPRPTDIQFQFHLSQHYEQSTPPPNCTSNGNIEDERMAKDEEQQRKNEQEDARNDPQLMEIASKFVNEIIETAKLEAARRQKAYQEEEDRTRPPVAAAIRAVAEELFGGGTGGNPWYRRAHGAISKWVTNLCVRAQNSMRT